eukprot:2757890-Amphidinium_carterae.2
MRSNIHPSHALECCRVICGLAQRSVSTLSMYSQAHRCCGATQLCIELLQPVRLQYNEGCANSTASTARPPTVGVRELEWPRPRAHTGLTSLHQCAALLLVDPRSSNVSPARSSLACSP